jgi:hypothetical protein
MYFVGVPWQFQTMVPFTVSKDGVTVIVTFCPTLVVAVLPYTLITPGDETVAPDNLPTTGMFTPTPAFPVSPGFAWNFSEIAVRADEAARINSETFARTV